MSTLLKVLFLAFVLGACATHPATPPTNTQISAATATTAPTEIPTDIVLPSLSITLGETNDSQGIFLETGGDVDTEGVLIANLSVDTRTSGNNLVLPSPDGNDTPDSFLQFNVDDHQLKNANPTSHVRIEVDYVDTGTDSFSLEYDALPAGSSDGLFSQAGGVIKTGSETLKTVTYDLCDAKFGNRDNGADFRINDHGDGAEFIHEVRVIGLPSGTGACAVIAVCNGDAHIMNVDDFGANPFDDQPDSVAIQSVLDAACSGDTIIFTSGGSNTAYQGYLIDKTLFLSGKSAKQDLTFTSRDQNDHALLIATEDLKGFVVQLWSRVRFSSPGEIDNIDFGYIDVNGNRAMRTSAANFGSWLGDCTGAGDPWCLPGNINMNGGSDDNDVTQDYANNPSLWSTGLLVHDLIDSQVESGTALGFSGAASTVQYVTIDTSGDHVHVSGCALTDDDGDEFNFADGITSFGPALTITNNTIINPSDVGIVFFGGKNTVISNNSVEITEGNYGAFAAIGIHPWISGDISGLQVFGNNVSSQGDTRCGGLHVGINIGPQMWGGGYVQTSTLAAYGNNGAFNNEPTVTGVAPCTGGPCQIWAYLPLGFTITMRDNTVTGAQINYLVEGLDLLGQFIDLNNISVSPQLSDWQASRSGCYGVTWGALDKVAHDPSLSGYTDLRIQCER